MERPKVIEYELNKQSGHVAVMVGGTCGRFQANIELGLIPKLMEVCKGKEPPSYDHPRTQGKEGKPTTQRWHRRAPRHGYAMPLC